MPRGEMERYVPDLRNSTDFRAERGVTLNVRRAMQAYRALALIDHVEKDVRGAVELTFRCAAQLLGVEIDACQWQGRPLWSDEYVLSADEKTSIQVRRRTQPTLPPGPHQAMRIEHEYERGGAVQYLAAWDVHRAVVFGRCEQKTGKAAYGRLVDEVMGQEPYRSARRVFWIIDNGSSHRGERAAAELRERHPRVVTVHTPVHASWLNQVDSPALGSYSQ